MIKRTLIIILWIGSLVGLAWFMQNSTPPFQRERDAVMRTIKQTENLLLRAQNSLSYIDNIVQKPVTELLYRINDLVKIVGVAILLTMLFFCLRGLGFNAVGATFLCIFAGVAIFVVAYFVHIHRAMNAMKVWSLRRKR